MQVDKKYRITKAAAKDSGRYTIDGVKLDMRDGAVGARLVATDGRILAVVPVSVDETDTDGMIHRAAMDAALKGKKSQPARIDANGTVSVTSDDGSRTDYGERPDDCFPDWRNVIPTTEPTDIEIRLNPFLLADLAEAIGAKGEDVPCVTLVMSWDAEAGAPAIAPIRVETVNGGHGVIMPVKGI